MQNTIENQTQFERIVDILLFNASQVTFGEVGINATIHNGEIVKIDYSTTNKKQIKTGTKIK